MSPNGAPSFYPAPLSLSSHSSQKDPLDTKSDHVTSLLKTLQWLPISVFIHGAVPMRLTRLLPPSLHVPVTSHQCFLTLPSPSAAILVSFSLLKHVKHSPTSGSLCIPLPSLDGSFPRELLGLLSHLFFLKCHLNEAFLTTLFTIVTPGLASYIFVF